VTSEAELVLPIARDGAPEGCIICAGRVAERLRSLPGIRMVEVTAEPTRLRYQYENTTVTPGEIERVARHEMDEAEKHYVHRVLAIEGMDCADCAKTLERGVSRLSGVEHAEVNFGAARMAVEFDRRATDLDVIDRRVR
jgi:copper chaperone CopZ